MDKTPEQTSLEKEKFQADIKTFLADIEEVCKKHMIDIKISIPNFVFERREAHKETK